MSNTIAKAAFGVHGYQPGRFKCDVTKKPFQDAIRGCESNNELVVDPFSVETKDWTAIVDEQCYKPCASGKILALSGAWDFSPQLLEYLQKRKPDTHRLILQSDPIRGNNFRGHRSGISQGLFYHLIAPLESKIVKDVQASWSQAAFNVHFKRLPKGAWLPEAAVDMETLNVLSEHGIEFTVLAPWQAKEIRKIGEEKWEYVGGAIDPSKVYKCALSNGKEISIFFFDDPITTKIAHNREGIYDSSSNFISHLKLARQVGGTITYNDLETWGHHHQNGTVGTVSNVLLELYEGKVDGYGLTNLSLFLAENPPEYEVKIEEYTSWSCKHGLGRWGDPLKAHCDCPDVWNSEWRAALRTAHKYLNGEMEKIYFEELGPVYFKDPKDAINNYVMVLMGRKGLDEFLREETKSDLPENKYEMAYNLVEAMRLSMIMNTSCGWFHNGIRRIEPVANMVAANSLLGILKEILPEGRGYKIEQEFERLLELVNIQNGGKEVYKEAILFNVGGKPSNRPGVHPYLSFAGNV